MNNFLPGLYIVSTPIGNLEDITLRALNVLKNSDKILCEDTRRSIKLLNHYKIKNKLISHHKFNEKRSLKLVVNSILDGEKIALISDAGTPVLSDPGSLLLKECIKKNIKIFPIPGASAITTAVSISGFDDKYFFYGFLPKKEKELNNELSNLNNSSFSIIFFIPGVKINYYLSFFKKHFSSREILIAREITKIHETFYRDKVDSIQPFNSPLKGELTVVISKKNNKTKPLLDDSKIKDQAIKLLKKNSLKDVVKIISEKEKTNKRLIYKICLDIKNEKIT